MTTKSSGTKIRNKGARPYVLHDGTRLTPGESTEIHHETVEHMKKAKFGQTGKTVWEAMMESGDVVEHGGEDDKEQSKGDRAAAKEGILAPPATSHLEQEEARLPENPESSDPKWQGTLGINAPKAEDKNVKPQHLQHKK